MFDTILYSELAWPDLERAVEEDYTVVLPVGSTEQHGPHLPICTDDYMAQKWAADAALLARKQFAARVLVLPGIHFGNAKHHMGFPGTVTLSFETLKNLVFEVGDSVLAHGFRKLVILNVHGGNRFAVGAAGVDLKEKYVKAGREVLIRVADDGNPDLRPRSMFDRLEKITKEAALHKMVHSGALETAKILYLRGDLVKMERVQHIDTPPVSGTDVHFYDEATQNIGASGRPRDATEEAGKIQWETHVRCLAEYLGDISKD
ncbi:MAG: creatininase family protein [Spirochaetales bacterium]|nr:creatininase family protein [Spirochaetales bacterium]